MKPIDDFLDDEQTDERGTSSLTTAAWFSFALGALALGFYIGREIRSRYKFKRRTPYDYFAHAGDDLSDPAEFGYGV